MEKPSFIQQNTETLERIARQTDGISIVCGLVTPARSETGKSVMNSAAVVRDGRVEFIGEGGVVARIARWTRGLPVEYSTRQTPSEEGGTIIEAIVIQAEDIVIEEAGS